MNNLKLVVKVTAANGLMATDYAYVELRFDDQISRTSTKETDLDPVWNEILYFNISDLNNLSNLTLKASVHSYNHSTRSKSFLGKVCISGSSVVPYSDSAEFYFPLENRNIFSRVTGELGLKVFITDNSCKLSDFLFSEDRDENGVPRTSTREEKSSLRHTFCHLSKQASTSSQSQTQVTSNTSADKFAPGITGQDFDNRPREINPIVGGGRVVEGRVIRPKNKPVSTSEYDLVEPMKFLFVRVVKADDLQSRDLTGSLDPYVEVKLGNYKGTTKHFERQKEPEWNEVFACSTEHLQATRLEVKVKDKNVMTDDFVGNVQLDLNEIPMRVPPDSPLAPLWYRLEDKKREKISNGELMLAVWYGTQADEAFSDAFHFDSIGPSGMTAAYIRSKVYHPPRLWYLRVNIIRAQDLIVSENSRYLDCFVKVQLGAQIWQTKRVQTLNGDTLWNDEGFFAAAEPFDEYLSIAVVD